MLGPVNIFTSLGHVTSYIYIYYKHVYHLFLAIVCKKFYNKCSSCVVTTCKHKNLKEIESLSQTQIF